VHIKESLDLERIEINGNQLEAFGLERLYNLRYLSLEHNDISDKLALGTLESL
jgi:Leucine-rich repeat (LRR) protein